MKVSTYSTSHRMDQIYHLKFRFHLGRGHICLGELILINNSIIRTFSYLGGTSPNLKHGVLIIHLVDVWRRRAEKLGPPFSWKFYLSRSGHIIRPPWQVKIIIKSTLPRTCPFDLKLRACDLIDIPNTKFYGFTSKFGVWGHSNSLFHSGSVGFSICRANL